MGLLVLDQTLHTVYKFPGYLQHILGFVALSHFCEINKDKYGMLKLMIDDLRLLVQTTCEEFILIRSTVSI